MKIRNAIAAAIMSVGLVAGAGVANALPASAPNVVGLTEGDAVATLQAEGIKVRVATRNGSCALTDQVVHHQQDLSGRTYTKAVTGTKTRADGTTYRGIVGRETIVVPPSTTLNMTCA